MKTNRTGLLGSAMSFAHFAGIGGRRRAEQDDDETQGRKGKKGRAEDDEDPKDAEDDEEPMDARAEDDEDPKDAEDDEEPKDARAEDDDDADPDAEDDEDPPKSKKGKAASADYRRGRKAERSRCAKIFKSAAAARNVQAACQLAFETDMSADAAIGLLKTMGSSAGADRAARNPSVGSAPSGEGAHSSQARKGWDAALGKASAPQGRRGGSGWAAALDKAQRR